jgi:uncharacterized protein YcnI
VPNESEKGSPTTQLTVALPNLTEVTTQQMPGWTAQLDRDVPAGTVKSITWTAAPNAGIAPDQFALFRVAVQLPKTDTVTFPATQTYADGTVVHWDQQQAPGATEPENPAPKLTLGAQTGGGDDHEDMNADHPAAAPIGMASSDSLARWLGAGGLVAGVAALVLALVRGRRT